MGGGRDLVVQGSPISGTGQNRSAPRNRFGIFFCNLAGSDGEVLEPMEVDSTEIYDLKTNQTTF